MSLTRRSLLASSAAIALLPKSQARLLHGNSQGQSQALQVLKLGAGGQFSGISIANDETYVIRTDTYGAYVWKPSGSPPVGNNGATGAWQQLCTGSSMPASFASNMMYTPLGVFEIMVAPSNSSIMYMVWVCYPPQSGGAENGGIFKSTNKGATWTQTAFTPVDYSSSCNAGDGARLNGQKMAIHPTNPNVVFVGFEGTAGFWATSDGGATWAQPSGFPAATGSPWITGIVFNPNNPTIAYGFSQGNGLYTSTNANNGSTSTWSKVTASGAPTSVHNADFAADGSKYYICTQFGGAIMSYNGTAWTTEVSGTQATAVACDPNTAAHVVAVDSFGDLNEHTAGGWGGWTGNNSNLAFTSPSDIPWEVTLGLGVNDIVFSRTTANKIYANCFNNLFTSSSLGSLAPGSTVTWTSQGVGEEQLVVNCMAAVNGKVIVGAWDHPIFLCDLSTYPTTVQPDNNTELSACWSLDVAKFTNTNFVASICDGSYPGYGGTQSCKSCYSTDGGATWTKFILAHDGVNPAIPTGFYNGSTGFAEGNIAVSTPTNMIWAATGGVIPQFTTDGGKNWANITVAGSPSFAAFYGFSVNMASQRFVCADPNNINTFYLWYPGHGMYKSTNSGANFSLVAASPGFNNDAQFNLMLPVLGQSGHLWYLSANSPPIGSGGGSLFGGFGAYPNNFGGMYFSTNGGLTVTQVTNAWFSHMSFGATAPGQSYPALYGVGFVSANPTDSKSIVSSGSVTFTDASKPPANTMWVVGAPISASPIGVTSFIAGIISGYDPSTGIVTMTVNSSKNTGGSGPFTSWALLTYGIWQCSSGLPTATPVWTQLGPFTGNNAFDECKFVCADPSTYGQFYLGFGGSGAYMRK